MVSQRATAKKYASSLLTTWQFGHCGEAVLIFCAQNVAMVSCHCQYILNYKCRIL